MPSREEIVYFVDKENKMELHQSPDNNATASRDEKPQSAINEETGEINWDCPCLKSALAPPCGEFFKEAFSCFVSSQADPKGSDCLEKFSAMQDCFRAHPEVYMRDDDESGEGADGTESNLSIPSSS